MSIFEGTETQKHSNGASKHSKNLFQLKTGQTVYFSEKEITCTELLCYGYTYQRIADYSRLSKHSVIFILKNCCKKVQAENMQHLKEIIRQSDFINIVLARIKAANQAFLSQHDST